jgi:hypothetical protein
MQQRTADGETLTCRPRCELSPLVKQRPRDRCFRAIRDAAEGFARRVSSFPSSGRRLRKSGEPTDADFAFKRPVHFSHLFLPRPILQIDILQLFHIPLPDFPSRRDDPILEPPLEMRRVLDEAEVEPIQGGGAGLGERGR